jgi:hypothetical protein
LTLLPAVQTGSSKHLGLLAEGMYGWGVAGALLMWGLGVSELNQHSGKKSSSGVCWW